MRHKQSGARKPFDAADYPGLQEFLPAYFHQDFAEEYGSAAEAVKRFLGEASLDEILQVKEEWARFRRASRGASLVEIGGTLGKLGSAWVPENEAEWKSVDEILSRAGGVT